MRLFVSVDLPDELADPIDGVQDELGGASGLRFTDPGQAHVTLKFLGETDEKRLPELEEALIEAIDAAGVEPFEAEIGGIGTFPSPEYISVVWLGVGRGATQLTRLHEAIESKTTDLGFDPEEHDFTPHVTIARMDHAGGKDLVQEVLRERHPEIGTTTVEEVRLKESRLREEGPEYSTVSRFPLP